ncbi:adenylate/guanylate cyclase family protein [Rivularia sp. PCC 7116]|uniref:nuclease A inhibitor family protein n=1 Tax=Rivularia sp. PCC 7116 TaxID=373994 RepID=UPI00029EC381|nr:nuclease A inhibitor family protein [Rivularia sp. PCC 7116]AFY58671.1 adenylate/guanylate cyclase family protein [Rivularia sp. PCC 7116]
MHYASRVTYKGSLNILGRLINERLKPEADKTQIDARIWNLFGDNWTVMSVSLSGLSRFVAESSVVNFLQITYEAKRILINCMNAYDSVFVNTEGVNSLILFKETVEAVECAIDMQRAVEKYNLDKTDAEKILIRVGIGYGKILTVSMQNIFGMEVNAASKLSSDTAKTGEILITDSVVSRISKMSGIGLGKTDSIPPGVSGALKINYDSYEKPANKINQQRIISELKQITDNLVDLNNSEYLFEVVCWHHSITTPWDLLQVLQNPPNTSIKNQTLDNFFNRKLKDYKELVSYLNKNLSDIKVYRIGKDELQIYIIGQSLDSSIGLSMTPIEI